jgi:hypothetical protein
MEPIKPKKKQQRESSSSLLLPPPSASLQLLPRFKSLSQLLVDPHDVYVLELLRWIAANEAQLSATPALAHAVGKHAVHRALVDMVQSQPLAHQVFAVLLYLAGSPHELGRLQHCDRLFMDNMVVWGFWQMCAGRNLYRASAEASDLFGAAEGGPTSAEALHIVNVTWWMMMQYVRLVGP